ncbi:MAG: replication factor C small subunit [Halanaeroarchaeum sp.]
MADSADGRQEIWVEKYRPESLSDVVGHEDIIDRVESYVARDDLPHLLFAGPAGTGKCVVGDTPVLTEEGLEPIETVVDAVDGFGEPRDGLAVQTYTENGDFEFREPSAVFHKEASELVTIETRDGGTFEVTPEHPVLTIDEEGLAWTPARDVSAEMRIGRPRRLSVEETSDRAEWYDRLDGDRIFVTLEDEFTKRHEFPTKCTREFEDQHSEPSTIVSLGCLRQRFDYETVASHVEKIQYVNANNSRSRPITPPDEVDAEIARFVGLLMGEARIDNGRVRFYNTDPSILEEFETTIASKFGLEPERRERKNVPFVRVISRTLVHYLDTLFDVTSDGTSSIIFRTPESVRAAFLQGVFDAEAYVSRKSAIELTQKDGDFITSLTYLLSTLGIASRRVSEQKAATNGTGKKRTYHTLTISGRLALEEFSNSIGFTLDEKSQRLDAQLRRTSNPNYDTIPPLNAVDRICERLNLTKQAYVTEASAPTRSHTAYQEELSALTDAARDRMEAANRALERLETLESHATAVGKIPASWIGVREELRPFDERNRLEPIVGARSDRLLEYADGRRTPHADRVGDILQELGYNVPDTDSLRRALLEEKRTLGVSFADIAEETAYRKADLQNVLVSDGKSLEALTRFDAVLRELKRLASNMLSEAVLGDLRELELIASSSLYFDEVVSTSHSRTQTDVYDLTLPETHNYVAGGVPTVMHNTATASAIAKELYGDDWRENFLELNASDERGIDVVRDRIKNFARSSFGGYNYRIIFLDEADALTSDAQSALRRTMEQFSNNTRFILSCNYSSQIIDPIQSRCAVFRFTALDDDAVAGRIEDIADEEGIEYTEAGIDALVYAADGDMRRAINALQAAAATGEVVDEETVYAITSTARPEEIREMITSAIEGDFPAARARLDELVSERGLAGGDIIDQLHRSVWDFDIDDETAVFLMDRLGEADYRISTGANERVQLEALLAAVALEAE